MVQRRPTEMRRKTALYPVFQRWEIRLCVRAEPSENTYTQGTTRPCQSISTLFRGRMWSMSLTLGKQSSFPAPVPNIASPEFEPPVPRERTVTELELVPLQEPPSPLQPATTPIPSVLPSLRFLSIPRQLHTSLSFLGPEHFQVSDTTSSELDMSL